jgi:hypothetical protein
VLSYGLSFIDAGSASQSTWFSSFISFGWYRKKRCTGPFALKELVGSHKPMAIVSSVVFKTCKIKSMPYLYAIITCACSLDSLRRPGSPLVQLFFLLITEITNIRLAMRMYFIRLKSDVLILVWNYGRFWSGWQSPASRAAKPPGWRSSPCNFLPRKFLTFHHTVQNWAHRSPPTQKYLRHPRTPNH